MGCTQSKATAPTPRASPPRTTAADPASEYARQDSALNEVGAVTLLSPRLPASSASSFPLGPDSDDVPTCPSPRIVVDLALPPSPGRATAAAAPPPPKKRLLPAPFLPGSLAQPKSVVSFLPHQQQLRRPATNPSPTSHHDVLLNVSMTQSAGAGSGDIVVSSRRRPRPLAIPTDSHYNLSTVLAHLVIGGDEVSDNLTVLHQLNVKAVVNTTSEGEETLGDLCYLKLNWTDEITQAILPDLDRAFSCIEEAKRQGGICLVHCKKGMSRSGAVVIAYLMYSKDMSLLEALTFARAHRAIIAPNLGFMTQLIEWERVHRGGRVTVDLSKYEENRFGDTASLCYGA